MSLSVYIHFPWCLQKCPYCDFASATIRRDQVPHQAYADAVLQELEQRAGPLEGQPLVSVFFGGGTPSLWDPEALGRVLSGVRDRFATDESLEVSVECNPSSLDAEKATALAGVGVNRLSIGVQSLDAQRLRFLGRLHDAERALGALREARSVMRRVSADLMFGMPGQTPEGFAAEVDQILALGIEHLSCYALTVEPATQFGELHRKGKLRLASEDGFADTFLATRAQLAGRGFGHYEVSNYARPGQEARHNSHYWRGGAYLGLGAGAVGCVPVSRGVARRYKNEPRPGHYMEAAGRAEAFAEVLDAGTLVQEALMLGLRTREGVDLGVLEARTGSDPWQGREPALHQALAQGDCVLEGERLRVPPERWLHLDGIIARIF